MPFDLPANREPLDELAWLATAYVLDELDAEAHRAFEFRLAHDQEAREALAAAVDLLSVIHASEIDRDSTPTPVRVVPAPSGRRLMVSGLASLAAAVLLGLAWFPELLPRSMIQPAASDSISGRDIALAWTELRATPLASPSEICLLEGDLESIGNSEQADSSGFGEEGDLDEAMPPSWLILATSLDCSKEGIHP